MNEQTCPQRAMRGKQDKRTIEIESVEVEVLPVRLCSAPTARGMAPCLRGIRLGVSSLFLKRGYGKGGGCRPSLRPFESSGNPGKEEEMVEHFCQAACKITSACQFELQHVFHFEDG